MRTKDLEPRISPVHVNTSLCRKVNKILIQLSEYRNLPFDTLIFHEMLKFSKGFEIIL